MGSFLLMAGANGKRAALPNSRVMIHQPSGGAQGQAADIEIQAREILKTREQLNRIYAERTGQTVPEDRCRHGARLLDVADGSQGVRADRPGARQACVMHNAMSPRCPVVVREQGSRRAWHIIDSS